MDKVDDPLPCRGMFITPDACATRGNATLGAYVCHFSEYQTCATLGETAVVDKMPVVGQSVRSAIHAHG